MTNTWTWWEKSKANLFPACRSWLNFRVRGQFEIKILIARHTNTTYFTRIKKNHTWACSHLKSSTLSADNFQKMTAVNWSRHWCPICVSLFLCSDPKLARKYEIQHWSRSSKTINWSADSFKIHHVTSMSWHMSPRYGHGILVSGYPVLTAFNWPYCECSMWRMWTCQDTPETPLPSFW